MFATLTSLGMVGVLAPAVAAVGASVATVTVFVVWLNQQIDPLGSGCFEHKSFHLVNTHVIYSTFITKVKHKVFVGVKLRLVVE